MKRKRIKQRPLAKREFPLVPLAAQEQLEIENKVLKDRVYDLRGQVRTFEVMKDITNTIERLTKQVSYLLETNNRLLNTFVAPKE